jgi:hypothetical protein
MRSRNGWRLADKMAETPSMTEPAGAGRVPPEGSRQFGVALIAGLIVVVVLTTVVYFIARSGNGAASHALPMGATEQAYVPQVTFTDFNLSRAENFLQQQVTYVAGTVSNNSPRAIVAMDVTLEFHDIPQNVVLRETQRLISADGAPLAAGAQRQFQLSFESIPDDWDRRPPKFIITGLQLQ